MTPNTDPTAPEEVVLVNQVLEAYNRRKLLKLFIDTSFSLGFTKNQIEVMINMLHNNHKQ